ncbi:Trk K+ transport system, NAD-binding component [Desulfomicrobium apsheronum]|uniref:Trk K+ transport system, NAD-binding component n=1 Tax=Desulfomicrobium apsheronum TaxID=52560 RepID=A0A1I3SB57_9BACT|nr:NAD-binding protein [Desulfomicrobium apsheronum]SFJ55935.1 Trk K+ transport system, NAD-binding component [Desulfomicrobium apsheronum]
MKFLVSQMAALVKSGQQKANTRLMVRFLFILFSFFAAFTVLFHFLMAYEGQTHSWITGLYWTLTVMSTLGFGDITFTSDLGRFFSICVMLSGVVFMLIVLPFTFIQFFYAPWLEEQNKARAPRKVPETMSNHVILTFCDAVTLTLVEKLNQYGIQSVILVQGLQEALNLHETGLNVVLGELDDPETYLRLRVREAAMVVVMNEDVASTNIIFTIREVADKTPVITNADQEDSVDILDLAGSTHTYQFTKMLGQVLARRVMGVSMKANVIGNFAELLIAEAPAMNSPLQGRTLAESRLRELTGVNVVGIWEQGRFQLPDPMTAIGASTVLVLAGSEAQLDTYDSLMGATMLSKEHSGPVVVLGGGRVGMSVAKTLNERGVDYRVVEKKTLRNTEDSRIIQGSAADLDILILAGINETPSIIITTHDDDLNIFLTIYCRRLRPDVQIISRASLDRNINTLHRAGANLVMSFSSLFTTTILNLLNPDKLLMLSEGLNIFRSEPSPAIVGKPLREQKIRQSTGCSIIAIKRGEEMLLNPEPDTIVSKNDELILIGTAQAEKNFIEQYPAA